MTFSNQNSLLGTVQQLKEIVSHLGQDHESLKVVAEMEVLAAEIDRKAVQTDFVAINPPPSPVIA